MKLKCIAIAEFYTDEFRDFAISRVKSEVSDTIKQLSIFNIKPEGEINIRSTTNLRFDEDGESVMGARASQSITGHWLDFLHAERAGIIPRQKAHIVCD